MEEVHQAGVKCSFGVWQPGAALSEPSPCSSQACCREGAAEAAYSQWSSKKNWGLAGEQQATAAALQWPQPWKDTEMYLGRFLLWKSMNFSSLNHQGSKRCKAEVRK